jgi:hypothetical protein
MKHKEANLDGKGEEKIWTNSLPPLMLAFSVLQDVEQSSILGCFVAQGIFKRQG